MGISNTFEEYLARHYPGIPLLTLDVYRQVLGVEAAANARPAPLILVAPSFFHRFSSTSNPGLQNRCSSQGSTP